MDFFEIVPKEVKGKIEVRPDFVVDRTTDLMVRGGAFYAVWDETAGLWSTSEYRLRAIVDEQIAKYVEEQKAAGISCTPKYLRNFSNGGWKQFKQFVKTLSDNAHDLDSRVTFANTPVEKKHYASRRLSYSLAKGSIAAYEELIDLLYSPEQRLKFEWAIGGIIAGDANTKKIQKFLVFYGKGGTGKSTVLDIVEKIFGGLTEDGGYCANFDARSLVGNGNRFATEAFRSNPLVAIQHDGDLSRIEDSTKLNSIVSNESMLIDEKFKSQYNATISAFLFLGTNSIVRISNAKSGLIRRLIDVKPTGQRHSYDDYQRLINLVDFEIGAIAQHCLETYLRMGKGYYNGYEPTEMIQSSDYFRNFVDFNLDTFKKQDSTTLKQSFAMFKDYSNEAQLDFKVKMHVFRESLKDYFEEFYDRYQDPDGGDWKRSYYKGFKPPAAFAVNSEVPSKSVLVLDETTSLLDELLAGETAQYANAKGFPKKYWNGDEKLKHGEVYIPKPEEIVSTVLSDLDTKKLHYVKVPENHIVIDFDLKDENGNKSLALNLEAASSWLPTYAELSKGGEGVHLHYFWAGGDVSELANNFAPGIEVKTLLGDSALRRRLSKCNNVPVATITSGLPFKEKPLLNNKVLKSEKGLRHLLERNLGRQIHPGTKPSVDFMEKILDQAYKSGMIYNVEDMRGDISAFANNSTNHALDCIRTVQRMKFKSEKTLEELERENPSNSIKVDSDDEEAPLVFFDIEVYPNLFMICWKYAGLDNVVTMINPSADDVEALLKHKLIGFNNLFYDNHMLWAGLMGWSNERIFELSQRIIVKKDRTAKFPEAYNLSWGDIHDFSVKKQGLKPWEIELGFPHVEMNLPWDQPAPPEMWEEIAKYCANDVRAAEAVFYHLEQDWEGRLILADLSGLTPNHSTRHHVTKIIFGDNRSPQSEFEFPDLAAEFPGYTFDPFSKTDKSVYRGETVGEGGYVYAEPGMYTDVAVLDVASMHPSTIKRLNYFGPYTKTYVAIMDARLAIKDAAEHFKKGRTQQGEECLEAARSMFDGRLRPYLNTQDIKKLKALAEALKLAINSTYGWTCAGFDNEFRHKNNAENVIAKRGALFMVDLKHAVQEQGFDVVHIKTDSIKIPNATPEIIKFVQDFGRKYGYDFNHEATYDRFCLVNQAVYIAKYDAEGDGKWDATGAQFQHPYVFKTLFTGEPVTFDDLCEVKQVKDGAVMYLDFGDDKHFVGKAGSFVPVNEGVEGFVGGKLMRVKDDTWHSVGGAKDHLWLESEMIKTIKNESIDRLVFEGLAGALEGTGSIADILDMTHYENLAAKAKDKINEFGDFDAFVDVA